jgi:acyl-CoA synthetase (AMP-forming)/AMP-acid ligase II
MKAVLMARWDPEHALRLIERHRVTFMMGPPTFFVGLRDTPGFALERVRSVRLISCGGAGMTPSFVAETSEIFESVVKRTYGSTEAPTVTTGHAGDDPIRLRDTDGRPTGQVRIHIGPADELWVRGPEPFVGYTDPARTAETVGLDEHGAEWFRTGDVGRLDGDWLTVTGRIKDLIIRGGENISAAEVESTLEAHPSVRQAVAVGEPDERLGEKVCAFVVCVPGGSFDLAACRSWFEDQGLTRFKTPERVVVVAELPVLAAGKIDRAALRTRAAAFSEG